MYDKESHKSTIRRVYGGLERMGMFDGRDHSFQSKNFDLAMRTVRLLHERPCSLSCLDIGCGSGLFAEVWRANGGKCYTGVDIRPMHPASPLNSAAMHEQSYRFLQGDYTDLTIEPHDITIASGALSVGFVRDRESFLMECLGRIANLSIRGFYFNFFEVKAGSVDFGFMPHAPEMVNRVLNEVKSVRGFASSY